MVLRSCLLKVILLSRMVGTLNFVTKPSRSFITCHGEVVLESRAWVPASYRWVRSLPTRSVRRCSRRDCVYSLFCRSSLKKVSDLDLKGCSAVGTYL
jgi:hypothetical protein